MEQLIYTDANRIDQGVLSNATLDLEYGRDESDQANTFEVLIDRNSKIRLEDKALVYIEGTEYGGKIKGIGTNTGEDVITYKGMTWHGLLNAHVLGPDSGQDYLVLNGEAHTVIRSLIERMNLQDIFTAPMTSSGININYQVRYEYGYFAILAMLTASSAKLKMTYDNGMVVLSAEPIADYSDSDELDTTQIELEIDKDYLPVNHLVCLGEGELKNRIVLHFYADADGNVSTTQSLFGADENTLIYDYTNADSDELSEKGQEKLKELQNCDTVKVDIPEGRVLDIGDLVGAIDPITGIYVATEVTYKTVTISSNGLVSIAYKVGDTSASKSMTGRSESSGGGVSYSAGKGITIAGRTINADVDAEDLQGVSNLAQDAKEQASDAASTAASAQNAADNAQETADAAVATISASSPINASRDENEVSLSHASSGVSAGAYGAAGNTTAEWGDTVTVGARMSINGTGHVTNAQGRTLTLPSNTATQDAKGLMSASDKAKLDGIAQGANKITVDSALSITSTNPVQNKVINTALAGKAASSHTHAATQITGLTASRALATNSSGQVVASSVSNTELSYLDGVTSAVQTQLNNKATKSHTHNYAGASSPGGAATSANKLATARTIKLTGAVNGQATFDGSEDITISVEGDSAAAGFLAAHPVGSVYESTSATSPANTYGGTWKYCPGFEFHRWTRTA
nr:MAG TPA: Protein gp18.1, prophage tail protein gp18.7A [Caudoviricetes sp.]